MITFDDPFERLLDYAAQNWGITVHVRFVHPTALSGWRGPVRSWIRQPKGETFWPEAGGPPEIALNVALRRGVQGTLDILAHELAHVAAGFEAGHGPEWNARYHELFDMAMEKPTIPRRIPG